MGLLSLSAPLEFQPVSQTSSVFFDAERGQVVTVVHSGGGVTGVEVRSEKERLEYSVRLDSSEPITSIKLSPSLATLAIQMSRQTVTFLPLLSEHQNTLEYSQPAKAKHCTLLGFLWLSNTDLLYITDGGLETFTVCQERRTVKFRTSAGQESLAWYLVGDHHHLVTSSQAETDSLTVWSVRGGNILKVSSLDLGQHKVTERQVSLLNLYLSPYIAVTVDQQILLFHINTTTSPSLSYVLTDVDSGTLGLHCLDNLVLVHSLALSRTKLYDLKVCEPGDTPTVCPAVITSCLSREDRPVVPYSPHWTVFLPNILLDVRAGQMVMVNMKLTSSLVFASMAGLDNLVTARFLLNRQQGKTPLLALLRTAICSGQTSDLTPDLTQLQQMLRTVVRAFTGHTESQSAVVLLDQSDIFTHVLNTFTDCREVSETFLLAVLLEYLTCLLDQSISPRQFLLELLINLCVRTGRLYQLHQLLQYHVITDSKPLACLLLSLESLYPPSRQMALDMMARLGTATHEITEILLDNGHIVTALNFGTEIFGPAPSCHLSFIRCFSGGQQWGRLRPCQEVS